MIWLQNQININIKKFIENLENKYKFIEIFVQELNNDTNQNQNIFNNNNFGMIYDLLNKIIKYSDNVNLIEHTMYFYDVDESIAKLMIENYHNSEIKNIKFKIIFTDI